MIMVIWTAHATTNCIRPFPQYKVRMRPLSLPPISIHKNCVCSHRQRMFTLCTCVRMLTNYTTHVCACTTYPLPRCTTYYTAHHNPPKYTINPQWDGLKVTAVQGHKLSYRQLEAWWNYLSTVDIHLSPSAVISASITQIWILAMFL